MTAYDDVDLELSRLQKENDYLRSMLDGRPLFDQATGILMAWLGSDSDSAFSAIIRVAVRRDQSVRCVSEQILAAAASNDPSAVAAWLRRQPALQGRH